VQVIIETDESEVPEYLILTAAEVDGKFSPSKYVADLEIVKEDEIRYSPFGKYTQFPVDETAFNAAWIDVVSSVVASPLAPKSFTFIGEPVVIE